MGAGLQQAGELSMVSKEPGAVGRDDAGGRGLLGIAAVERDTGLSKDTLRVWERRYDFPRPQRDALGERAYSIAEVEKLRLVRRLLDAGHRPGRIVRQPIEALRELVGQALAGRSLPPLDEEQARELDGWVGLVRAHEVERLRQALSRAAQRLGLGRFIIERAAPLDALVDEAGLRGEIEVGAEHLYVEALKGVLRSAVAKFPARQGSPRVLLATFPGEWKGQGLLMAEALLALDGCHCVSMGVQTPLSAIVGAAGSQRAEVVVLTFSAMLNANRAFDGLAELRGRLESRVQIWAVGCCPGLQRRPPEGVRVVAGLAELMRLRIRCG